MDRDHAGVEERNGRGGGGTRVPTSAENPTVLCLCVVYLACKNGRYEREIASTKCCVYCERNENIGYSYEPARIMEAREQGSQSRVGHGSCTCRHPSAETRTSLSVSSTSTSTLAAMPRLTITSPARCATRNQRSKQSECRTSRTGGEER